MECNEWIERGLLFTADELDEQQKIAFETHVHTCSICQKELHEYETLKNNYLKKDFLEVSPPKEVDAEIIRLCSNPRLKSTSLFLGIVPLKIKSTIISVIMILIGFGGGSYLTTIRMADSAKKGKNHYIAQQTHGGYSLNPNAPDSSQDIDTTIKHIQRGNLDLNGVVPVDLKEEEP